METREKQLKLWKQLIVDYHCFIKVSLCIIHDCPLWSNPNIQRTLSKEDLKIILNYVVDTGSAEWVDSAATTTLRILWFTPQELASNIYVWARENGHLGSVVTLYELHSGDGDATAETSAFQGLEEELIRRALTILESEGKCTIFQGETSSEDGIKFH